MNQQLDRPEDYVPPQITDLGNHQSFVQALRLSSTLDGVYLGGGVFGSTSPT